MYQKEAMSDLSLEKEVLEIIDTLEEKRRGLQQRRLQMNDSHLKRELKAAENAYEEAVNRLTRAITKDVDQSICPLCQKPNGCAIACGRDGASCWCNEKIVDPEVLKGTPQTSCMCCSCLLQLRVPEAL